ncbi:probable phospholipid-transporting ATPase 4 [Tanacetum coccineum]
MQITNTSQMVKLEKDPMLDLKLEFLNLVVVCAWVICCRVSPKQKELVTRFVKEGTRKMTLAIRDGDYIVVSEESTKVLQEGGLNVVFHHLGIVEDESIKSFYDRVKESTKVLQEGGLNVVFHHLDIVEDDVQWDEPSSILRPDKVSPWDLEPLVASNPPNPQTSIRVLARFYFYVSPLFT